MRNIPGNRSYSGMAIQRGGALIFEELRAAVELVIATGDRKYAHRIEEMWSAVEENFEGHAALAVRSLPYLSDSYRKKMKILVQKYKNHIDEIRKMNPFGVPVSKGGWAGNGRVVNFALTNYLLHREFPDIIEADDVYRGLNYIYGCHPGSDLSFVSGVGTVSKRIAYGNNRADFSFIAGGVVPGVLILKPDFPENKEDWPFVWAENEYVINLGSGYLYLVKAVIDLLQTDEFHNR